MKYLLYSLLLLACCALPLSVYAQEHALAPADTLMHAVSAEGQAEGGEHKGDVGETLIEVLSHHLLDAEKIEFFGFEIHLPTVTVGTLRLITKHQVWWVIAMLLVFLVVRIAGRQTSEVPTGLRNAFEVLIVFLRDEVLRPNLHGWADAFLPYFLTLFTSILFSNLLGLLPWGSSATGNINVTAGLALCSLGLMIGMGIKQNGLMEFLHVFAPPGVPGWLMPLMIVIEILSFLIRPFALTIRLFANMLAGHAVVATLLGLIVTPILALPSVGMAVGVTFLEILVAFIQAYIFCMLTAVFMSLTMHPSH